MHSLRDSPCPSPPPQKQFSWVRYGQEGSRLFHHTSLSAVSLGLPLSGTRQGDTVQMDVADDRESDGEWGVKDVLVAIEIEHDGEPDDEIMRTIICKYSS